VLIFDVIGMVNLKLHHLENEIVVMVGDNKRNHLNRRQVGPTSEPNGELKTSLGTLINLFVGTRDARDEGRHGFELVNWAYRKGKTNGIGGGGS